jgi:autotransporter strand-loop-strand O-heptosyltransferase
MDVMFPRYASWKEFALDYGDDRFCGEKKFYKDVVKYIGLENVEWLHMDLGNRFDQVDRNAWRDDLFQCHFIEGPFLHIVGISDRKYDVTYSNSIDGNEYSLVQKPGVWSRPSKKFYRDWTITVKLGEEVKFQHTISLAGMNVIVSMGSKALGDTLAWIPYVEEFRKKHGCNVYCSTWWNDIMDYPLIHFIKPGDTVQNVYASYEVGCFDTQLDRNVIDWRLTPLQKVGADILGIDYIPIPAKLKYEPYKKGGNGNEPKPYICFSEFSTMQNKMWNREGAWQKVIDYLNSLGYDCVSISTEPSKLTGIVNHNGQPIEQTLTDISGAAFYVGLNAGPTWIAYSLGIPAVMITGVSEEWNDFSNPYRIAINNEVCGIGCFNDPSLPISRAWEWCPRNKNYSCTREITEIMVMETINRLIDDYRISKIVTRRKKSGVSLRDKKHIAIQHLEV